MGCLDALRRACCGAEIVGAGLILLGASAAQAAGPLADGRPFSLAASALYAAVPAVPPSDDADIAFAEVHETYAFEPDGSNRHTLYLVYKILTPAGAESWWNALTMHWSPWRDDKPAMRARVISPDGTQVVLEPATIADSPAHILSSAIYSDQRIARAPLPAIGVGAVVEAEIVV